MPTLNSHQEHSSSVLVLTASLLDCIEISLIYSDICHHGQDVYLCWSQFHSFIHLFKELFDIYLGDNCTKQS